MKSILLIGLGRFGRHMAIEFSRQKQEIMAIDKNEERINDALPYVTNAQIGDATSERFMASLGVRNFDLCVVAIGDDFQSSLEATALLKDCGASFVLARASRDVHARFLLHNGADRVVYPEKEMAVRTAVTCTFQRVFDYITLAPDCAIYEVCVPSGWVGHTVVELQVRSRFHITVLAVKKDGHVIPVPDASHIMQADERLLLLGAPQDIRPFL